jgi:hypothetical protein
MIRVDVRRAVQQLNKAHRDLSAKERGRAMSKALNRAVQSGRANAAKETRRKYNVRSTDVKKTITLARSTPATLEARFKSVGSTLPLMSFRPNKTKKGITAKIGQSRKLFPGAFMSTTKSGHKGIFARAKYKGNKLVSRRTRVNKYPDNDLPIVEIQSLTVPSAIQNKGVINPLTQLMQERLVKEFSHELRFRTQRAAGLI